MTSEYVLLMRVQDQDEQAIGELYDLYAPRIYAYLYRRVHEAQLAEDLTSEGFVRVLQAVQSERFWHTSFRAWLYRIAHNLVTDYYRRQPAVPLESLDELPVEEEQSADPVDLLSLEVLRASLHTLTPDQQHVLALRFGEKLKTDDVAEIMGKSVKAVEALQHRALIALRKLMEAEQRT